MRPHAAAALLLATAHGGALPALSLPLMPQAMLDVRRNANYLARAGYVFTAYKAFQLKFSPLVVRRAMTLKEPSTGPLAVALAREPGRGGPVCAIVRGMSTC